MLRLRRGQTVLIFGASGAVGTLAIQFAKRRGARVIATATGRKSTRLVLSLGAEATFDARADNAVERLRELAPDGLDAVLAFAGGPTLDRCLDLVKPTGRVAYPNGVEPEPKRRRRRFSVEGYDGEVSQQRLARLERTADETRLQVRIAAVYPLAQAARAHARLERGQVIGRIVLRIARGAAGRSGSSCGSGGYCALERASTGSLDLTEWLSWFLEQVEAAMASSEWLVNAVLRKARFWVAYAREEFNERQLKALSRMLDAGPEGFVGGMTNKKYQHLTGSSAATGQRDLADLVEKGCLILTGGGRSVRYELAPENSST